MYILYIGIYSVYISINVVCVFKNGTLAIIFSHILVLAFCRSVFSVFQAIFTCMFHFHSVNVPHT